MNRQIPTINKIIKFGELKRYYELHESKVKNAKTTLTTRGNILNKTNYIQANRIARTPFGNSFNRMIDIELQNKALLKKLTQKSKFNSSTSRVNPSSSWNSQTNFKLNRNINKKKYFEEYQLQKQNQGLLKRIKQTKPLYQMQKYVSQRKITQQYINSISKYGYKGLKPTKTIIKFQMVNNLAKYYQKSQELLQEKRSRENSNSVSPQNSKRKEKSIQLKLPQSIHKTKINQNNQYNKENLVLQKIFKSPKKPVVSQQTKRPRYDKENLMNLKIDNNSSLLRTNSQNQNRSHSNSPQSSSHTVTTIPQKSIKINGKKFILKGKQYFNKVCLEIINCKNKQIGHDYIHEVEIQASIYMKRFQGRIDILIQHLKYDKTNDAFYLQ